MSKAVKISIIIAVVIIAGAIGGFVLLTRNSESNNNSSNTSQERQSVATITYSDSGFSPSSLIVSAGDTITIKNSSTENLQFSSDNHPSHTNNPELNQTELGPDQSQQITLTQKGTWGYHNHLNPNHSGTVTVE